MEDRHTQELIKLEEGVTYNFTDEKGLQNNRFFIHLRKAGLAALQKELAQQGIELFSYKNTIAIRSSQPQPISLSIYTLSGIELHREQLTESSDINTALPTGIYLVRLETAEGVFVKRLMLE